jgi:Ca2+-binding EF-hand superfamily protein
MDGTAPPLLFSAAVFSLVFIPDLQAYSDIRLKITQAVFKIDDQRDKMFAQIDWVRTYAEGLNVKMVLQSGDLTQTNFPDEWALSESAMRQLDGVVPYLLCLGNHDMGYEKEPPPGRFWVSNRRDSLLNEYFPPGRFQKNPLYTYGGNFEGKSENYYLLFEAEGLRFIALSIEFMPRDEVLVWANQVIGANLDRRCLVLTHGYLDCKGERNLRGEMFPIEGNTAQGIWDKLLRLHANIFLVLSGHDYGESRRTDLGIHGNEVHQVMANYQWWENGGMGWLRVLQFYPSEDRIDFKTYSPVLNRFRTSPSSQFSLSYLMTREPARLPNLSPLHMRKLRHVFGLFDANHDGRLEQADFLLIRDRFANMLGMDFGDPMYLSLDQAMAVVWRFQGGDVAERKLSMREFLEHWSANISAVVRGGAEMQRVFDEIDTFVDAIMRVVDANGDGNIGCIEFLLFLKAVGVDHGQIATFKKLDVNRDGYLSLEEFRAHARDFFLGNDPGSMSNHLFGPLDH